MAEFYIISIEDHGATSCVLVLYVTIVEPRFNDLRYNDIPVITINIRLPSKSYSNMYGTEPRFNDLRYNDIPGLAQNISDLLI